MSQSKTQKAVPQRTVVQTLAELGVYFQETFDLVRAELFGKDSNNFKASAAVLALNPSLSLPSIKYPKPGSGETPDPQSGKAKAAATGFRVPSNLANIKDGSVKGNSVLFAGLPVCEVNPVAIPNDPRILAATLGALAIRLLCRNDSKATSAMQQAPEFALFKLKDASNVFNALPTTKASADTWARIFAQVPLLEYNAEALKIGYTNPGGGTMMICAGWAADILAGKTDKAIKEAWKYHAAFRVNRGEDVKDFAKMPVRLEDGSVVAGEVLCPACILKGQTNGLVPKPEKPKADKDKDKTNEQPTVQAGQTLEQAADEATAGTEAAA